MSTTTAMPTDADLLTLAQWLSPAYPVGAFAYSHGVEQAIEAGQVRNAAALRAYIEDILAHGGGFNDALFLAAAHKAEDPAEIDATCRAFAASRERLLETEAQGAGFAAITSDVWGLDLPDLCYPVAVGFAAGQAGLPLAQTSALFLQAFVSTLASVGQRLIPIGQTEAQGMIARLAPLCQKVTADTLDGDLDRLSSVAFLSDIAAMRHETQYSRIFRT